MLRSRRGGLVALFAALFLLALWLAFGVGTPGDVTERETEPPGEDAPVSEPALAAKAPTEPERIASPATTLPLPVTEEPIAEPEERIFGLPVTVHVRELASRAELMGVELRALSNGFWGSSWQRPRDGLAALVVKDGVSPITLRAWRHAEDRADLVRGFEVSHAGVREPELVFLSDGQYGNRGFALWVPVRQFFAGRKETAKRIA